jgi:hypothetical protein
MAFSPTDPASTHSLWLQLRNTKRKRRPGWRSDWMPLWVPLLLLSVLLIFYTIMPSNHAAEHAQHAAHEEGLLQERPMKGALGP